MAITEVYVDPAINANSGTGTIGDPYGNLQYALNTKTRDTTNGDRFNVKAGTAEVLTAALSLATYGAPTSAAPLVIQGYTSAAGDGGIGEISGAATYSIISSAFSFIAFADMKIGNCGSATLLGSNTSVNLAGCEVHGSSAATAIAVYSGFIVGCYIHSCTGGVTLALSGTTLVYGNYFKATSGSAVITAATDVVAIINNLFVLDTDTSLDAIRNSSGSAGYILNNTIYTSAANTGDGIEWQDPRQSAFLNNVIVGFSGAGGNGLNINYFGTARAFPVIGGNAFYNNATNASISVSGYYIPKADISLASSPFKDATGGDYSLAAASAAREAAWPLLFKGLSTTDILADIGAVQAGAGASGGMGGIFGSIVR